MMILLMIKVRMMHFDIFGFEIYLYNKFQIKDF